MDEQLLKQLAELNKNFDKLLTGLPKDEFFETSRSSRGGYFTGEKEDLENEADKWSSSLKRSRKIIEEERRKQILSISNFAKTLPVVRKFVQMQKSINEDLTDVKKGQSTAFKNVIDEVNKFSKETEYNAKQLGDVGKHLREFDTLTSKITKQLSDKDANIYGTQQELAQDRKRVREIYQKLSKVPIPELKKSLDKFIDGQGRVVFSADKLKSASSELKTVVSAFHKGVEASFRGLHKTIEDYNMSMQRHIQTISTAMLAAGTDATVKGFSQILSRIRAGQGALDSLYGPSITFGINESQMQEFLAASRFDMRLMAQHIEGVMSPQELIRSGALKEIQESAQVLGMIGQEGLQYTLDNAKLFRSVGVSLEAANFESMAKFVKDTHRDVGMSQEQFINSFGQLTRDTLIGLRSFQRDDGLEAIQEEIKYRMRLSKSLNQEERMVQLRLSREKSAMFGGGTEAIKAVIGARMSLNLLPEDVRSQITERDMGLIEGYAYDPTTFIEGLRTQGREEDIERILSLQESLGVARAEEFINILGRGREGVGRRLVFEQITSIGRERELLETDVENLRRLGAIPELQGLERGDLFKATLENNKLLEKYIEEDKTPEIPPILNKIFKVVEGFKGLKEVPGAMPIAGALGSVFEAAMTAAMYRAMFGGAAGAAGGRGIAAAMGPAAMLFAKLAAPLLAAGVVFHFKEDIENFGEPVVDWIGKYLDKANPGLIRAQREQENLEQSLQMTRETRYTPEQAETLRQAREQGLLEDIDTRFDEELQRLEEKRFIGLRPEKKRQQAIDELHMEFRKQYAEVANDLMQNNEITPDISIDTENISDELELYKHKFEEGLMLNQRDKHSLLRLERLLEESYPQSELLEGIREILENIDENTNEAKETHKEFFNYQKALDTIKTTRDEYFSGARDQMDRVISATQYRFNHFKESVQGEDQ